MRKLSAVVIARWAKDMNVPGDVAERMIEGGTPEFRMVVLNYYRSCVRGAHLDAMLEDIDQYYIDQFSFELDRERETGTGAFSNRQASPRLTEAERDRIWQAEQKRIGRQAPPGAAQADIERDDRIKHARDLYHQMKKNLDRKF